MSTAVPVGAYTPSVDADFTGTKVHLVLFAVLLVWWLQTYSNGTIHVNRYDYKRVVK